MYPWTVSAQYCSAVFHSLSLLCCTPLRDYTTLYLFFLLLIEMGCFHLFTTFKCSELVSWGPSLSLFGYILRSETALSKYMFFFSFSIWCQIGFQKDYTNSHSHLDFWILASLVDMNKLHLNYFDLHFLDYERGWASFHTFIDHSDFLLWEWHSWLLPVFLLRWL